MPCVVGGWDDQFRVLPTPVWMSRTGVSGFGVCPTPLYPRWTHRTNSRTESGKRKSNKFLASPHMNSRLPVFFLLVGLYTTAQVRVI